MVLDHYHFVRTLPPGVRRLLEVPRETLLVRLPGKGGEQTEVTCTPCGFDREGEVMLVLRFNGVVITRISFSFIRWQGKYVLFIGGLQGPSRGTGTEVIRRATRACHGLFPRRILCEVAGVVAQVCGVEEMVAVSEELHVLRGIRYWWRKRGRFVARYSECWASAGGVHAGGFYYLSASLPRRAEEDIPVRKRAEYRRRHGVLDRIRHEVVARGGMMEGLAG